VNLVGFTIEVYRGVYHMLSVSSTHATCVGHTIHRQVLNTWYLKLKYMYRVSQEECARLRQGVPYVKVYRYNPKHLCPKLNAYGTFWHIPPGTPCIWKCNFSVPYSVPYTYLAAAQNWAQAQGHGLLWIENSTRCLNIQCRRLEELSHQPRGYSFILYKLYLHKCF